MIYDKLKNEAIILKGEKADEKLEEARKDGVFEHQLLISENPIDKEENWIICTCGHSEKMTGNQSYRFVSTTGSRPIFAGRQTLLPDAVPVDYHCPRCHTDVADSTCGFYSIRRNLSKDLIEIVAENDGLNFEMNRYTVSVMMSSEGERPKPEITLTLMASFQFKNGKPTRHIKRLINNGTYRRTKLIMTFFDKYDRDIQCHKNQEAILKDMKRKIPRVMEILPVSPSLLQKDCHELNKVRGIYGILILGLNGYFSEEKGFSTELTTMLSMNLNNLFLDILSRFFEEHEYANDKIERARHFIQALQGNVPETNVLMPISLINIIQRKDLSLYDLFTVISWYHHDNSIQEEDLVELLEYLQSCNVDGRYEIFLSHANTFEYYMLHHGIRFRDAVQYLQYLMDYQDIYYGQGAGLWKKYLDYKKALGETNNLFPNSLHKEERLAQRRSMELERKKEEPKYQKIRKKYRFLEESLAGYKAKMPETLEELAKTARPESTSNSSSEYLKEYLLETRIPFNVRKAEDSEEIQFTIIVIRDYYHMVHYSILSEKDKIPNKAYELAEYMITKLEQKRCKTA